MENFLCENVRIHIESRQEMLTEENGLQENDHMETVISGRHYYRGGKHYLLYEEMLEGIDRPIACRMKISSETMEMTRQGDIRTTLIFEEGQSHKCNYHTPYGMISLETETIYFHVNDREDSMETEAEYTLVMDEQPVSKNKLHVDVKIL